jgi:hypothetical protein
MGASPFLGGLWQNPYKGKAPFFRAITKLHNKDYTTALGSPILKPMSMRKVDGHGPSGALGIAANRAVQAPLAMNQR